jgi:hypothetical protein
MKSGFSAGRKRTLSGSQLAAAVGKRLPSQAVIRLEDSQRADPNLAAK